MLQISEKEEIFFNYSLDMPANADPLINITRMGVSINGIMYQNPGSEKIGLAGWIQAT